MKSPRCAWLLLVVATASTSPALADRREWSTTISGEVPTSFNPVVARPLPSGGAVVSGTDAQGQTWAIRLGSDLRQEGAARFATFGFLPSAMQAPGTMAVLPFFNDGRSQPDPARLCLLQRGLLGLDVRTFDDQMVPAAYGVELRRFDLDQAGGHYAAYQQDDGFGLARFGIDCRREDLLTVAFTEQSVAIPNARAAYAVVQREFSVAQELLRVEGGNVAWRYSPDASLDAVLVLFPAAPDGDALFRLVARGSTARENVERWMPDGQRRWTRALAPGRIARGLIPVGNDTLLVEGPSSSNIIDVLRLIDAAGSERWSSPASAPYLAGELGNSPRSGPVWLRLQRDLRDEDLGYDLVRVDAAGATTHALPPGIHPWLLLPDGSLLVTDHSASPHRLQQRYLDRPDVRDLPLSLPPPVEPGGIKRLPEGVLVATRMADASTRVDLVQPGGTFAWTRRLPVVPGRPASSQASSIDYLFAANADRVCLWQVDDGNLMSHIACLRRADGTPVFEWVAATHRRGHGERVMSLDADGAVHAIGGGCLFEGVPVCRNRVERLRLASDGGVVLREEVGTAPGGDDAFAFVASPDARRVAVQGASAAQFQLTMRAPDGTVAWSQTLAAPLGLLGLSAAGELLTLRRGSELQPAEVSLLGTGGQPRWRRALSGLSVADNVKARLLGDGSTLIVSYSRENATTQAIRLDAGGRPLWEQQVPYTPARQPYGQELVVSEMHGSFIRQSHDYTHGDRLVAYSLEQGEPVDAVAIPPTTNATWFGASTMRFDLDDAGKLAIAVEEPNAGRVRVESLELQSPGALPAVADETMLGMWYALDTSGQGFFLDHDAATGTAFGTWFTFSAGGGHDPAQQRWFTLVADGSAGMSRFDYRLLSNAGGVFAAGPPTTAAQVGAATLQRTGCDTALLQYRYEPGTEEGVGGVIPLRRLAPAGAGCSATIAPAQRQARLERSGAWYVPEQSGQGLVFDFHPVSEGHAGHFSAAWFTYDVRADDPTAQHWFTLAGSVSGTDASIDVPIYRTTGGALDAEPTSNTFSVGAATLRFADCNRATLEYRFDVADVAHAFSGRHGTLELRRLGACPR
jgi:hypothetical protein